MNQISLADLRLYEFRTEGEPLKVDWYLYRVRYKIILNMQTARDMEQLLVTEKPCFKQLRTFWTFSCCWAQYSLETDMFYNFNAGSTSL